MTLAGFLPPIWLNDAMLVDGGYLNVRGLIVVHEPHYLWQYQ